MYIPTKELRELQFCQLEILKQIDRVCKSNGIEYFLYGGTLLGAVRHKGFIPWDDDLDIAMMRDDFERFIDVAPYQLPDYLFVQNYKTDDYPFVMTKVRNSKTTFIEPHLIDKKINHGVFVDIMIMDNVPDDLKERMKFERKLKRIYYLIHFGRIKKNKSKYAIHKRIASAFLEFISRRAPLNTLINKYNELIISYNDITTECVGHTTKAVPSKRSYKIDDILPLSTLKFEDDYFPVPRNYDAILCKDYGDYMSLPSEEKQHPNHSYYYNIHEPYAHHFLVP